MTLHDLAELRALAEQTDVEPLMASLEESVAAARLMVERLGGYPELATFDQVPGGCCAECERFAEGRFLLGIFALCRDCLRRRVRVAAVLAAVTIEEPTTKEEAA